MDSGHPHVIASAIAMVHGTILRSLISHILATRCIRIARGAVTRFSGRMPVHQSSRREDCCPCPRKCFDVVGKETLQPCQEKSAARDLGCFGYIISGVQHEGIQHDFSSMSAHHVCPSESSPRTAHRPVLDLRLSWYVGTVTT